MKMENIFKKSAAITIAGMIVLIYIMYGITAIMTPKGDSKQTKTFAYENVVALTFDDGPCRCTTTKLLEGLAERDVKATFFLVGCNITGNEDIIERMNRDGHLIGNHTYTHVQLDTLTDADAIEEVRKTNEVIAKITGKKVSYIRPPYGLIREGTVSEIDMQNVLWSVDPEDWNTTNVSAVVNHVVKNAKNGDIILMHDIYDSSVAAALEIVDRLKAKGYVFVTVDQILLD